MNVTFDPAKHTYTTDQGRILPSVTEILGDVGAYGPDADRYWTDEARNRGTAVHNLCAEYNCGLPLGMLWERCSEVPAYAEHPTLPLYLAGWVSFCLKYAVKCRPDGIEAVVWHEALGYAGTADLITSHMFDWHCPGAYHQCIIDIKTGQRHPAHRLQTEAYRLAWRSAHPGEVAFTSRACVYLSADGTYELVRHTKHEDTSAWMCAFGWRNWRFNNGLLERRDDEA
jgi:hypothetical protein